MFQNIHVAVFPITESDRQTSYVRKVYQLLNSYGAKVIDLNVKRLSPAGLLPDGTYF